MTDSVPKRPAPFRHDGAAMRTECASFVRAAVDNANAAGVVVELDGRLGSSVTATVAVEALGPERVFGLVLPSSKLGSRSAQDAEAIASALEIETETIHLQPLLMYFSDMTPDNTDLHSDPVVRDNLVARLRMAMAYFVANATKRLVVGSATRTELLLGSVTKYGDGAADLFPLGGLYATEAAVLGDELSLPSFVADPLPMAGPYPGQSSRFGIDSPLEAIDTVLYRLVETGWEPDRVRAELDVDTATVDRIVRYHHATGHKRRLPPIGPSGA